MDVPPRSEVPSVGRNGADERIVRWHRAGRIAADPVAVLRDVSARLRRVTRRRAAEVPVAGLDGGGVRAATVTGDERGDRGFIGAEVGGDSDADDTLMDVGLPGRRLLEMTRRSFWRIDQGD